MVTQENFPKLKNDMKLDIERSYCLPENILTQNNQHKTYSSKVTGLWRTGKKILWVFSFRKGCDFKGEDNYINNALLL